MNSFIFNPPIVRSSSAFPLVAFHFRHIMFPLIALIPNGEGHSERQSDQWTNVNRNETNNDQETGTETMNDWEREH